MNAAARIERLRVLGASRGRTVDELLDLLETTLSEAGVVSPQAERDWTAGEASVLADEEIDVTARRQDEPDAAATTLQGFLILAGVGSANVHEAADALGKTPSRIRQLLGMRRIYGFKSAGEWRLPVWQFAERSQDAWTMIPGLAETLEVLDPDLSPLTVTGFFVRSPQPELVDPVVGPLTPRDWLRRGGDPSAVVALARDL